jgi:hypothetical protein
MKKVEQLLAMVESYNKEYAATAGFPKTIKFLKDTILITMSSRLAGKLFCITKLKELQDTI